MTRFLVPSISLFLLFASGQAVADAGAENDDTPEAAETEAAPEDAETSFYGEAFELPAERLSVSQVIEQGEALNGQTVTIQGEVADVCQRAGCWAVLREGELTIRILSRAHGYAMPKDARGRNFVATGTLQRKEVDPERTAHYASESEHPEAMPENGRTVMFILDASGVARLPSS